VLLKRNRLLGTWDEKTDILISCSQSGDWMQQAQEDLICEMGENSPGKGESRLRETFVTTS
jgi:hypothetical protein